MEDIHPEEDSTEARAAEINSELLQERKELERPPDDDLHEDMPPALPWKAATLLQASSSDESGCSTQEQQTPLPRPEEDNATDPQEDLDEDPDGIIGSEASLPGVPPQPPHSAVPVDNDTQDVHVGVRAATALDPLLDNGRQALRAPRILESAVEDDGPSVAAPEPEEVAVVNGGQHTGLSDTPEQRPLFVSGGHDMGVLEPQEEANQPDSDLPEPQEDGVVVGDQQDSDELEPQENSVVVDQQDYDEPEPQEGGVGVVGDQQDPNVPVAYEDGVVVGDQQDSDDLAQQDDAVVIDHQQVPEPEEGTFGSHAQDDCLPEPQEDAVGSDPQSVCLPKVLVVDTVSSNAQDGCEPVLEDDAVGGLAGGLPAPPVGPVECGAQEVVVPEHSIDSDVSMVQTGSAPSSDDTLKFDEQETGSTPLPDDAMDTDQVMASAPSPGATPGSGAFSGLAALAAPSSQGLGHSDSMCDSSQQAGLGVIQGLQGALPSEAELIRALRRHCCWVCGATAPSHDANISHMVTHLQGAGSAASTTVLISPVSSDTSLADTAPMPLLGPSPSREEDQDKQNNFVSGCKEEPTSLFEDLPSWTSSPTPAVDLPEPSDSPRTQPVDDMVSDDCDTFPSAAGNGPTPTLPRPALQEPETISEVTHLREPPRFSYAGRKGDNATAKRLCRLRARALIPALACACPQPVRTPSPSLPADAGVDTEDLKLHLSKELTSSPPKAPLDQDSEADADPSALVCAICLQAFPSRAVLLEHVAGEVRTFGQQARRGRRPRAVMVPSPPRATERIPCPQCPATFSRRYDLRCHARAAHPDGADGKEHRDGRPHACRVCPMRFRRLSHLQQHTLVHTGAKPFRCDLCGEHFRRKDRLVMHVKQHKQRKGATRPAAKASARTVAKTQPMQAVLSPKSEPKSPIKAVSPASPSATSSDAVEVPADATPVRSEMEGATEAPPAPVKSEMEEAPPAPTPTKRGRGRPRKAVAGAVLAAKVAQLSEASLLHAEAESQATAHAAPAATKKAKSIKAAPQDAAQHCHTCGKVFPAKSKLRQHVLKAHAATMRHVCLTCGHSNPSHEQLLAHVAVHTQQRMRERAVKKGQAEANVKTEPVEDDEDEGAHKTGQGPLTRSALASAADTASGSASGSAAVPRTESGPAPTPGDPAAKPKTQPRVVLRFVSKHGVKDAANVAAKFLPQLARDLASKGGLKNVSSDSKNRKVVYMMVGKRGAEGHHAAETAGAAGDAGAPAKTGTTRKVIFKVVSKKRTEQKVSQNTLEQPKPGLKVVSRMVSLDSATNAPEQTSKTVGPNARKSVAGVFPLALADPVIKTEALDAIEPTAKLSLAGGVTAGTRLKSSTSVSTASPRAVPYPGLTPIAMRTPPATSTRSSPRSLLGASPLSNVVAKALTSPQADNRYLCNKCDGRFLGEIAYLQHVRSHGVTQIKAYQCHCCYVKFFDKELLKAHMHTHL